ncbi:MAG: TatD family hydrolase [Endomicrobium sp.]|jgi:TatD DNase family protein|nr:TatD family hydrolase [Endomicrobium sp.]
MIIDTHAHICDVRFDNDREEVIKKTFNLGVKKIIEVACETNYWDKALKLSKRDNIFVSFGIHPIDVFQATLKNYCKLEILVQSAKCVAVGEFGLDYHYNSSPENIELQKKSLARQFNIAIKYNKPVIIHCRDAYDDMIMFLKEYENVIKGVIHCFSGSLKQAKVFVEMGFLLGIDGPITYKKSKALKQIVCETDISKLLVETDCPYLTPQKYRGQRNEPSYLLEVVKAIASIKNISVNDVAQITTCNAVNLFNI